MCVCVCVCVCVLQCVCVCECVRVCEVWMDENVMSLLFPSLLFLYPPLSPLFRPLREVGEGKITVRHHCSKGMQWHRDNPLNVKHSDSDENKCRNIIFIRI
jgi:hypothetical protein